ncbi:MAG: Mn(2+) uptake NRAMP transporter MntH [bacterium]|nr:Mn(2+) uptake NRAMP transporter MntH [bacterium]
MSTRQRASLEEVHHSVSVKHKSWLRRLFAFVGPAYLVSVGYMDPGNWATDIEGGARFGYTLIWVLLMSNWMAILLQTLSARLGIVTGRDLAQGCRAEYPPVINFILWILCEIAIAACDLAEVLGTIIGLKLLFGLPLIWGCLVTVFDTFLLLYIQRFGMRKMEAFIVMLVATIGSCFIIEIFLAKPDWGGIASGFIPHLEPGALYVAIGMLGATVMPHNLYLHSALVQTRRVSHLGDEKATACWYNFIDSAVALNAAFFVNAAILIMAAATFWTQGIVVNEIEQAHGMLETLLGSSIAPTAFGLALLCAGQSSTLTGTLAGQIVMEGFVHIRLSPWLRRLITRSLALIPAASAILIFGEQASYQLLILSQVILSLQLPFAIIPLIHFTSEKSKMGGFASPGWVKAVSWGVAAIIVALNGKLVFDAVLEWASAGGWLSVLTIGVIVPIVVFCLAILFWITVMPWIRGGRAWIREDHNIAEQVLGEIKHETYNHIGVALEREPHDSQVLSRAVTMARRESARLTLIHVVDTPQTQVYGEQAYGHHAEDDQTYLDELARELEASGLSVGAILRYGNPVDEIVKAAKEEELDMLILGSHGHRWMGDLLWGQTVDPVRHALTIPVMVVRAQETALTT